jgi:hypothetical protein
MRPPWEFRSARDKSAFKTWMIARLDERYESTAEDLQRELIMDSDKALEQHLGEATARQIKRGRFGLLRARKTAAPSTV